MSMQEYNLLIQIVSYDNRYFTKLEYVCLILMFVNVAYEPISLYDTFVFFTLWKHFISKSIIVSTFCSTNAFLPVSNIHMKSVILNQPVAWNQDRWLITVITHILIFFNYHNIFYIFAKYEKIYHFRVYYNTTFQKINKYTRWSSRSSSSTGIKL